LNTEISLEELMAMSEEERRHVIMSSFGEVFPDVQRLIVKLSIMPSSSITETESAILLHALYLSSIEYTRYCNNLIPEGEPLH
jgi:hypothetical protein